MTVVHHYTQITLHGLDEAAGRRHVAWIPSERARLGGKVRIDGMAGRWLVVEWHDTITADWVEAKARDHLHQREASDV